jgi:hypothetical protein
LVFGTWSFPGACPPIVALAEVGSLGFGASRQALQSPPFAVSSGPCRFTSFIATNARRTARFWFAQAIGKGPHARIVVPRNSVRSSPSLRRPFQTVVPTRHLAPAHQGRVACAAPASRTRTKTHRIKLERFT